MSSTQQRAIELFHQALERPTAERAAFLIAQCGPDQGLREEVDTLLDAYSAAGDFLAETAEGPARSEAAGVVIDRYKLLEQIGEGGFGVVWLAEQREPVRRKVALKVIKLGMDTLQVIARFEAERQALALMDHPNIAKVLDGGATDAGRPYFVMELVSGVPITDYCDQAGLEPTKRLELFQQVCHAVQHAHQKGVIHRDLKPGNILVKVHDGIAVPKVIDFGIAKATGQELTQKTLFTEFRQMVGTPEYMAPEQAEMSGLDVDTRADVYSLGVILYELLTGTKPFDLGTLADKGYVEMIRHIREVDPPKPSTRVSTLGDRLTTVAKSRRVEPDKLGRVMRGDLDAIVMRALEKNRSRRYSTASALAEDVRRSLEGLPVEAAPPSAVYQMRKFVARHRGAVAGGAIVLAVLLAGLVGISLALSRARAAEADERAARERAQESEARAVQEAQRAQAVIDLTNDMLGSANPHSQKGAGYTVRELLDDFDRGLESRLQGQPEIEASIRATIGAAYRSLGLLDKAEPHVRTALEIRRRELGEDDARYGDSLWGWAWLLHDRGDYAESGAAMERALELARQGGEDSVEVGDRLYVLGDLLRHQGKLDQAEQCAQEALGILRRTGGDRHPSVGHCLNILALIAADESRFNDAEELQRESLAVFRDVLVDSPVVAAGCENLGKTLSELGEFAEAERLFREALAIRQKHLNPDDGRVAITLSHIGSVLSHQGENAEAEKLQREALVVLRREHGDDDPLVATSLDDLAMTLRRRGRSSEAEPLLREALEIRRRLLDERDPRVVMTRDHLGLVLSDLGRHEEAERLLQECLDDHLARYGDRHTKVAMSLYNLGLALYRANQNERAEGLLRDSVDLYERHFPTNINVATALSALSLTLRRLKRSREAEPIQRRALELYIERQGDRSLATCSARERLATTKLSLGESAQAEKLLRQSLDVRKELMPTAWQRWNVAGLLGVAWFRQGKFADAEPLMVEACEQIGEPGTRFRRRAVGWLVEMYDAWEKAEPGLGKSVEAARWRKEL